MPPDGGLTDPSFIMCEMIRSVSPPERFTKRLAVVTRQTLETVRDRVRILLNL